MLLLSTGIYIVTFFLAIVVSLFVLLNNSRAIVNRYFFLLGLSIGLWILTNIIINVIYIETKEIPIFFAQISIIWVALLPIFFNQFIKHLYFPFDADYDKKNKIFLCFAYATAIAITSLCLTNYNLKSIDQASWGIDYQPGTLYILLLIDMLTVFGFSFFHLLQIFTRANGPKRYQAGLVLLGASITVVLSILTNIIFPFLGHGFMSMFGPVTAIVFLFFITYSITRHHLFNIRIIAIEIITFALWIIMLLRIIVSDSGQEALVDSGVLIITIIFGTILIRSVLNEMQQREYIEKLTKDLQKIYSQEKFTSPPQTNPSSPPPFP